LGISCGDPTDTSCDAADSCNGGGSCLDNFAAASVECRTDAGECDLAELCDGLGVCPADAFEAAGTACSDDNLCTEPDSCDAGGNCQAGSTLECDDDNICTADACDELTGCSNTPVLGCTVDVPAMRVGRDFLIAILLICGAILAEYRINSRDGPARFRV
jgi:hypothetical protein